MKLLTICFASLLLVSCSERDNTGRIESLKVLESCALGKCAEGDEQLGRVNELLADKTSSEYFLEKVRILNQHMVHADSLSIWLMTELNTLRSKIIKQKSPKSDRLNKPAELEYSAKTELNEDQLPNKKQINGVIKQIELYRNELCKTLVESQLVSQVGPPRELYYFNIPKVLVYKNDEEKTEAIRSSIKHSRINEEDIDGVVRIMELLTEKKSTWKSMLSSDQDWIDLSMGLLSIQQKVLSARHVVFRYINVRSVSCQNYNITKFTPIVLGSTNALPNDTVSFEVLFVGYNEYFDHQVTVSDGARFIKNEGGKAYFEAIIPASGELNLNGEIKIQKKSGYSKPRKWSHTIKVLEQK